MQLASCLEADVGFLTVRRDAVKVALHYTKSERAAYEFSSLVAEAAGDWAPAGTEFLEKKSNKSNKSNKSDFFVI